MFCPICGCPVRPQPSEGGVEDEQQLKWLGQAVMLSDPAEEFETLELHYRGGKRRGIPELLVDFTRRDDGDDHNIQRDNVTVTASGECVLEKDGSRLRPYWSHGYDETGAPYPNSTRYAIVTHAACLDLAERVMTQQKISSSPKRRVRVVRSLGTLWKVLRARLDTCENELMSGTASTIPYEAVWEGNFYFMFMCPVPGASQDWRQPFWDQRGDWLLEDPTTTPNWTSMLLSRTKPAGSKAISPATKAFRERFLNLPLELREHIILFLSSCDDLHMSCTRLLPQEVWCDMLLGKKLLPFLHDIDEAAIDRFIQDRKGEKRTEIDWESLVRSLSRGAWASRSGKGLPPLHEMWEPSKGYYYCDLPASGGLRNRRRIWQLVEEMFVGDMLPHSDGVSVPRYWDEYGERVYPVVRLSAKDVAE